MTIMDDKNREIKLGDKVWVISRKEVEVSEPCKLCDGRGSFLHKKTSISCPLCHGTGKLFSDSKYIYSASRDAYTVGMVRTTRQKLLPKWRMRNEKWVGVSDGWEQKEYMFDETGIGTGVIYDRVFLIKEEAEKFANELNKEQEKEP
jgi:hypothetical protein